MKHLIDKTEYRISVEELQSNQCEIEIYNQSINDSCFIRLNLNELHSFIGTLLHVQQKIKNK